MNVVEKLKEVFSRPPRVVHQSNAGVEYYTAPLMRRGLSGEVYGMDKHGTIHRRMPKRNKQASARQWRKAVKAARAALKLQMQPAL